MGYHQHCISTSAQRCNVYYLAMGKVVSIDTPKVIPYPTLSHTRSPHGKSKRGLLWINLVGQNMNLTPFTHNAAGSLAEISYKSCWTEIQPTIHCGRPSLQQWHSVLHFSIAIPLPEWEQCRNHVWPSSCWKPTLSLISSRHTPVQHTRHSPESQGQGSAHEIQFSSSTHSHHTVLLTAAVCLWQLLSFPLLHRKTNPKKLAEDLNPSQNPTQTYHVVSTHDRPCSHVHAPFIDCILYKAHPVTAGQLNHCFT